MKKNHYPCVLSIDIGASNGRGTVGYIENNKLITKEVYRFLNNPIRIQNGIYWDYIYLYKETLNCIKQCRKLDYNIVCIGIDTWGQDYALVNADGRVIGSPRSYLDPVLPASCNEFDKVVPVDEVRKITGRTKASISTLRQIYYDHKCNSESLKQSQSILYISHLLNYMLTGEICCDATLLAAGELLDISTIQPSYKLLNALGVTGKMPPLISIGDLLGYTNNTVNEETGYNNIPVACVGGHDTSCAVFAIPEKEDFLYLSSGTWSMYGIVTSNLEKLSTTTYDGAYCIAPHGDGRYALQAGTEGMLIIQQCMKQWKNEGINISYEELTKYALSQKTELHFNIQSIDSSTIDMCKEISVALGENGFTMPNNPFDIYVAFSNSVAKKVSDDIINLENKYGASFDKLYIVGGGSQATSIINHIQTLTRKQVVGGLIEAASVGNMLNQFMAINMIQNQDKIKELVAKTFYKGNSGNLL
jgi:rhamnulokinase